MSEDFPSPLEDPVEEGAAIARQMLDLQVAPSYIIAEERRQVIDERLAVKLQGVGITFPDIAIPRGVLSPDQQVADLVGANIVGSPLYLVSPEGDNEEIRLHEMVHGFLQSHLIPDQPRAAIEWARITDTEAVALAQGGYNSGQGELAEQLADAAKDTLTSTDVAAYRSDPRTALRTFVTSVDSYRDRDSTIRALDRRRGRESTRPNFEAVATGVNQRIVGSLREQVYGEIGMGSGIDFEEVVATYFAHHALGGPPTTTHEFHQGERAKQYTLLLAGRYQDPKTLARQLKLEGMEGVLAANSDLFEESATAEITNVAEGRYAPLSREAIDRGRTQILSGYAAFRPVTEDLRGQLKSDPERLRGRALGAGVDMMAIPMTDGNREYVARVPLRSDVDITSRLEGAARGLGVHGLEQAIAASTEEGYFYSEMLPGKVIRKVGYDEQVHITDDQLAQLVDTVMVAAGREITIDTDQGNILYDPDAGFSITDYSHKDGRQHSVASSLVSMAVSIGAMGRGSWNRDTPEAVKRRQYAFSATLIRRFSSQCSQLLDAESLAKVQQGLTSHIGSYEALAA